LGKSAAVLVVATFATLVLFLPTALAGNRGGGGKGEGCGGSGGAALSSSPTTTHAVQRIELYIDGAYRTTWTSDGIDNNCALSYKWWQRRRLGSTR
jgi:hypothetical protein